MLCTHNSILGTSLLSQAIAINKQVAESASVQIYIHLSIL